MSLLTDIGAPFTAQEVFFSLCNPIMDKRDKNMSTYHNILG